MNTCTESIFESITRKLNALGVTLHREGEVEYPDGTFAFKNDAALLYTDGGVDYRVVKTETGYRILSNGDIVARGEDEYDVDVLVEDIYCAVVGTSIYTLADWQQEVAAGNTTSGYRDWASAKGEPRDPSFISTPQQAAWTTGCFRHCRRSSVRNGCRGHRED